MQILNSVMTSMNIQHHFDIQGYKMLNLLLHLPENEMKLNQTK